MTAPFVQNPAATCDACGKFGAYLFEGEALCGECYAGRGACCSAEFSGTTPARPAAPAHCNAPGTDTIEQAPPASSFAAPPCRL